MLRMFLLTKNVPRNKYCQFFSFPLSNGSIAIFMAVKITLKLYAN